MSFFLKYPNESPLGKINEAITRVVADASKEWRNAEYQPDWTTGGYGIVSIRPYHIQAGGTYWGSSNYWASCYAASNTWEAWISITQTDQAFEIITGYFNLEANPKTTEMYFNAAGKDLPTLNIEDYYSFDGDSGFYFKSPLVVGPTKPWKLYHKAKNTGVELEGLKGFTVAPQAFLILRA